MFLHPQSRVYLAIVGIFWNEDWNHIRRFTLVSMRDFGLGKKSLEGRIQEEAVALTGAMEEQGSSPFRLQRLFGKATSNIICSIIVGHRYRYHFILGCYINVGDMRAALLCNFCNLESFQ